MAAPPGKFSAKIATVVALIPLGVLGWIIAPLFLPVWRWSHLDFAALAQEKGVSESDLRQQYQVVIRHAARSEGDPMPWQIMTMTPPWTKADENELMVRATIISDRSGEGPSTLRLGSGHRRDKYFQVMAWRLPPGSLGFDPKRPVLVYDGGSLEKLDISQAERMDFYATQGGWANDDDLDSTE